MPIGDIYSPEEIDAEIDKYLPAVNSGKKMPLPKETVKALLMAENMGADGKPVFANRVSNRMATGVGQVIPETIRGLKGKGFLPPDWQEDLSNASLGEQIATSLAAMSEMSETLKSTDPLYMGAYYNGGTAARKAYAAGQFDQLPAETQKHLSKIKTAMKLQTGTEFVPTTFAQVKADPAFRTSPLQAAEAVFTQNMTQIPALLDAIGLSAQTTQAQAAVQQAAIAAGGQAAAESHRQQAEITISEQETHREIMNALGLDVRDPQSQIRTMLTRESEIRNQRVKDRSKIADLQGISFFTNPLDFLMAQPQLQAMIPQYNAMVDEENDLNAEIGRIQTVAAAAKNLTPAKAADNLRAKAAADAEVSLSQAQLNVAQSKANAAAGTAKSMMDQLMVTRSAFSDMFQLENAQLQRSLQAERMDEQTKAKKLKEAEGRRGTQLAAGINLVRKSINGPAVKDLSADEVNAMPAEMKGMWTEVLARGSFGNSYAESIPFIERFGNMAAASESGNATMMLLARNTKMQAERNVPKIQEDARKLNPLAPPLKYDQALGAAYNQLFNEHSAYAEKKVDKSNLSVNNSPYAIDYDAALAAATAKGAIDNSVIKALAQFKQGSQYETLKGRTTDRMILDAVNAQVVSGQVSPQKAAEDVSKFYTFMSLNTYISNGLQYFGLPKLQDYTIAVGAKGSNKVDLMNPVMTERYLTAQVARARAVQQMNQEFTDQMGNPIMNLGVAP